MATGDAPDEGVHTGQQDSLRSRRQHVRQLVQNGLRIPGFDTINGFSHAFLKSLVDLAHKHGDPHGIIEGTLASFLARVMVVYSCVAAFAVQPGDPDEYRSSLAEGLRLALGFSSGDISSEDFLGLLEDLIGAKAGTDGPRLCMLFGMLHKLVTDFLDIRHGNPTLQGQQNRRVKKYRASRLMDDDYWTALASSIFQSSTWLGHFPHFIEAAMTPPLRWEEKAHILAFELEELGDDSGKCCAHQLELTVSTFETGRLTYYPSM